MLKARDSLAEAGEGHTRVADCEADLTPLGLRVVVDDDGTGATTLPECLEDDNAADWTGDPCPG